jgi:hypothetical protein
MRSSSLVFLLLSLLVAVRAISAGGAAAEVERRQEEQHHGGHAAAEREAPAFYLKVGKFAVWIYSLHHGISPVPKLERVVSAATRPDRSGRGVEYLLVLRVARLGTCEALVWGVPGEDSHEWKLKDFKPAAGA